MTQTPPVLFIIFNRPEQTRLVFAQIRAAAPRFLFIASDGPRKNKPSESEIVAALRQEILASIDWPCEVKTLFRGENVGCRAAVSSAITWFFSQVEAGVILEDDCLPDSSFFAYCGELLNQYRNDSRVMHIAGTYLGQKYTPTNASYFGSRYNFIWGWATWQRAWQQYNVDMPDYPQQISVGATRDFFRTFWERKIWKKKFDLVFKKCLDTWDYQWTYAIRKHQGICIVPKKNLISNIGFGATATHTMSENHPWAELQRESITALVHPEQLVIDEKADRSYAYTLTFVHRLFVKIKTVLFS